MNNTAENVKIHKANLLLQQKIGKGPLDKKLIKKAQQAIEENDVDFTPLGLKFLKQLEEALNHVEENLDLDKITEQQKILTDPVMELKANAGIFHYPLVGNLANIMLSFLESINTLDSDALAIVRAHHDTLQAIIVQKMRGNDEQQGDVFLIELKEACARYYRKRKRKN